MIVITAPTGNIGSRVLSRLFDAGEDLRVIVRDPARLPEPVRERVEVVAGSHGDPEVVDRAFAGADAVFWVVPPDSSRAPADGWSGFTGPAAKALVAHQVGHVVGVSALGRGTAVADQAGLVTASLAMDELIAGTGVAYRALANPSFFENLLEEVDSIREKGVYADVLDPDRKAPLVAVADIAAVAARLLRDRSWTGFADVPVLGPEDLSPHDVARIMSEQLGRPVCYERESLDDLRTTLIGYGLNEDFVHGIAEMKHAKDNGLDAGIARTAGTASETTFEQWCAETLKPAFDA
ncbi:NAD(P)H-binding protein [Amycolatopsis sp. FU40]|uniref:NAD(P)H-binding protein n=1 Tax=Amycolatopsis sp. FU40 TaxID=2914159 RepID=UPI001F427CEC|nr:NAD(P)H-binding protein [Amycolatopsis sp. FU40]UKD56532.1 NAD(P)H-binding protein [Amycolatopsis sp. FU40]